MTENKRAEEKTQENKVHEEIIQNKEEINRIVDNLTLMDDDLMALVFDDNIPATELLLNTILVREDIEVISVVGQREYRNPNVSGRTVRLDIVAKEKTGVVHNVEVQRSREGASPRRARFHSSTLDVRMLTAGQEFNELKDSYVIFITEEDYFHENLPVYTIRRNVDETKNPFTDGSHIIYVNGSYEADDALGMLAKDFRSKEAKEMHYSELAEGVRYFKEEEGRESMCEAVERYAEKYANRVKEVLETRANAKIEEERAIANAKVEEANAKANAKVEEANARAEKAEAELRILQEKLARYESA